MPPRIALPRTTFRSAAQQRAQQLALRRKFYFVLLQYHMQLSNARWQSVADSTVGTPHALYVHITVRKFWSLEPPLHALTLSDFQFESVALWVTNEDVTQVGARRPGSLTRCHCQLAESQDSAMCNYLSTRGCCVVAGKL